MVNMYWHIKNLLKKVLSDRSETKDEHLVKMEELHLLSQIMDVWL